jgi:hypothetical protein
VPSLNRVFRSAMRASLESMLPRKYHVCRAW